MFFSAFVPPLHPDVYISLGQMKSYNWAFAWQSTLSSQTCIWHTIWTRVVPLTGNFFFVQRIVFLKIGKTISFLPLASVRLRQRQQLISDWSFGLWVSVHKVLAMYLDTKRCTLVCPALVLSEFQVSWCFIQCLLVTSYLLVTSCFKVELKYTISCRTL